MWCLTMFDAPVKTAQQRKDAAAFRHLLLDRGFSMLQLSVYIRYNPSATGVHHSIAAIKRGMPPGSKVCILMIGDHTWAQALRFSADKGQEPPDTPIQLTIF